MHDIHIKLDVPSSLINHLKMDGINHPKLDIPFKFNKSSENGWHKLSRIRCSFKYKSSKNGWHKSSKIECLVKSLINHPKMDGINHSKLDVPCTAAPFVF